MSAPGDRTGAQRWGRQPLTADARLAVRPALVRAQRGVVEAPVPKWIGGRFDVPLGQRGVDGDLLQERAGAAADRASDQQTWRPARRCVFDGLRRSGKECQKWWRRAAGLFALAIQWRCAS